MKILTAFDPQTRTGKQTAESLKQADTPEILHTMLLYYSHPYHTADLIFGSRMIAAGSFMLRIGVAAEDMPYLQNADLCVLMEEEQPQMTISAQLGIAQRIPLTVPQAERSDTAELCALLLHMIQNQNTRGYAEYAANNLLHILLYQCRSLTLSKTVLHEPDINTAALVTLREQIYSSPAKRWSIEDMCDVVSLSRAHLHRLYTETFGCACYQDVLESRLQYACKLLEETDAPICSISQSCGFESDSTFIRAFKKQKQMTPTAYRRNNATSSRMTAS